MNRKHVLVLAAALLSGCTTIVLVPLCAHAEKGLMGDLSGQYVRVYDGTHLARHPDQLVREVNLSIKRTKDAKDDAYWSHAFMLSMRLRGRDVILKSQGDCRGEGSGLRCRVECDGGGIRIEPRRDHVIMYLDRIRMATCGESVIDGGEDIHGGKDDRVFRLNRVKKIIPSASLIPPSQSDIAWNCGGTIIGYADKDLGPSTAGWGPDGKPIGNDDLTTIWVVNPPRERFVFKQISTPHAYSTWRAELNGKPCDRQTVPMPE